MVGHCTAVLYHSQLWVPPFVVQVALTSEYNGKRWTFWQKCLRFEFGSSRTYPIYLGWEPSILSCWWWVFVLKNICNGTLFSWPWLFLFAGIACQRKIHVQCMLGALCAMLLAVSPTLQGPFPVGENVLNLLYNSWGMTFCNKTVNLSLGD